MSGYCGIVGNIGDWIIVRDFGCERATQMTQCTRENNDLSVLHARTP